MDNYNSLTARHRGWRAACAMLVLCVVCGLPPAVHAARSDSFEGGEPRWLLVESDCGAQLTSHEISLIMPHGGRTCEMFEVACAVGSMALMAYPIEPSLVLDEFRPSLWTRCSSGRLQLGVRIIFPFAEHPVTQGRLNTIVWGETYSETGHWQRLQVAGLEKQLSSELVSLRQRFGGELNLEGAYIDALVLNAYTGPGRYRVQVDDLNLNGLIPLTATGGSLPANWREKWRWRYEVFKPSAEQRFWVSPNRPPTWLHYRGESLPWVRSIGFAGLILNELPSEQQLGRIREAELGAISPPPTHNVAFDATAAQALKGWSIGSALDARQSEVARRQVQRVTQLPSELRRPLVGEALEHYWMFSRIADEVILPFPAPLTAGQTAEKIAWAAQNLETTKKRGDGWVSLDVGPNPALVDQLRAAHAIIAPQREFDAVQANPLGLRYQAACAAVAGARGLVFRTFKPLDLQAPGDSATVAALRWIHSDLALWGPWMVSGQTSAAPTLDRPDYTAAAWNVSHSRLVIALVSSPAAQHCLPSTGDQPLQLSLASSATPQQILRVTEGRLQRVEAQATPEGLQWRVERPAPVETFVITSNPLVIDYVRGQLSGGAEQRVADQLEIASYNMGLATQLVEARYPPLEESLFADGDDPLGIRATLRNLAIAQRQLDQGYQAMHSRQAMGAFTLAARASDLIQAVLAEAQQTATSNLATPQASPFVLGPTSLGYHWQLAEACARSEWRPLDLPGAQFQDLQQMLSQGWSLEQRPLEQVDQQVELVPARSSSPPGLRLAAYAQTAHRAGPRALAGGYEGATARVRSSAAAVRRGQLIRISGKARVLRAPTTAESGILLYDNQAGPSLGQLVRGQLGEVVDIELYRFVVADGEFRILAECRGECDIILESLQASVIEPATNRQSFLTFPSE